MVIPKLRFKEFTDEWNKKKLGEISESISYGMNSAATEFDGKNKYIRITDIDENSSTFNQKNLVSPLKKLEDKFLVKNNDILFARTGASTGKTYLYNENDGILYYAGFLIKASINKEFNSRFIFEQFNLKKYSDWIKLMSMRSGQPGINANEYASYELSLTTKLEQDKISGMLELLNKKIELQSKKIEVLKLYKKGICTSIFAQNENYDYKLLSDLDIYISDGNYGEMYPNSNELKDNGDIPFIRVNNLKNLRLTTENMKYISAKKHQILLSGHLKENDILITTRGEIGKVAIVDKKFVDANINAQIALLRVNNRSLINPYFILEYLNYNNKYIQSFQTGSALKQLPIKNLKKLKIPELNIDKQNKIGRYFNMYNYKLMLENNKLNKLRELKKRLMQNMFV